MLAIHHLPVPHNSAYALFLYEIPPKRQVVRVRVGSIHYLHWLLPSLGSNYWKLLVAPEKIAMVVMSSLP